MSNGAVVSGHTHTDPVNPNIIDLLTSLLSLFIYYSTFNFGTNLDDDVYLFLFCFVLFCFLSFHNFRAMHVLIPPQFHKIDFSIGNTYNIGLVLKYIRDSIQFGVFQEYRKL